LQNKIIYVTIKIPLKQQIVIYERNEKMKKLLLSLAGLICTFFLALVLVSPMRAEAATTFKTLKNANTVSVTKSGDQAYYKFGITEDSLVHFSWTNATSERLEIAVYKDKAMKQRVKWFYPGTAKGDAYLALKKGTYYVEMYEGVYGSTVPTAKVKYTFAPVVKINQDNYCRAKAQTIKAGTTVKLAQTPQYDYVRWYKFSIPKAKKVAIKTPQGNNTYFDIYSTSLQRYNVEYSGNVKMVTKDKLPAGMYFIRVMADNSYIQDVLGTYIVFNWE
jgi:uncharacterized protein YxeA